MKESFICVYNNDKEKFFEYPFRFQSLTYKTKNNSSYYINYFLNSMEIINIENEFLVFKGGYGKIYKVLITIRSINFKEDMKVIALMKYIDKHSITGILEPYIMLHMNSEFLNRSIGTFFDAYGNCKIIQPVAEYDVAEIVRKKNIKLDNEKLKKWCWQIVCGIYDLHIKSILHGDIKARNILIFDDNVKITDFGVSILLPNCFELCSSEPEQTEIYKISEKKIQLFKGDFLYTPTHRPPEIFKNKPFSFSADIWAMGCTFYEMAFGKLLFEQQNSIKSYIEKINEFDLSFNKIASDRPVEFIELLKSLLKINPDDRINILEILEHGYFKDMKYKNIIKHNSLWENELADENLWKEMIELCKNKNIDIKYDERILKYTNYLYKKAKLKSSINFFMEGFLKISYKILYNTLPEQLQHETYDSFKEFLTIQNIFNYDFL